MEQEEGAVDTIVEDTPVVDTPEPVVVDREAEARRQLTARAKAAEARAKAAEAEAARLKESKGNLDVEDYIDISASLEGLDQREKEYLAEQHRLSGKSLKDIRGGEDFQLWDTAYRAKLEKEVALRPSTTQPLEDVPKTLTEALRTASLAEKEEILRNAGLYKDPRRRADRVVLPH